MGREEDSSNLPSNIPAGTPDPEENVIAKQRYN